ncbi:MAG: PPC domain-containing protein [Brevundimonas sp.]|uniref:PPC domain-containing protein n=1 Tax=Brevundimonas sp. TaxID=1871086 RepID=UPI002717946C|nr:PPC domain-containing protein [Brevundimonas sp.]MDO9587946.1 PPC domain-containing protein [Brevundimonas sp.]MDP3371254.1 PPC domain-containing protein [Brevundimonas sp.]MDP3655732.1 PPC domain-containing protein [Brevundimonas sp.]MDZ4109551.1 PPC domain-containing protein [Brevundimonas sp.]
MRRQTILTAAGLLALSIAAPALAQASRPLSVGTTVEGRITTEDPAADDGSFHYDSYTINVRAGQRLEAIMRAGAFDAFLEVYRPGEAEPLASDDDGLGEGTDSRLRFTADRSGAYVLRARPLSGPGGGAYSLSLTERPPAGRAPRPTRIRLGQSLQGELGVGDPETDDGLVYDAFAFRARAGERFAIDLIADAFDPVVRVGRMEGRDFSELAMNDDGPDGSLNSRLVFTAPTTGEYVIRATPLIVGGEGAYTLALATGPEPAATQTIEIGGSVQGELTEDDGRSEDGDLADAYRFTGREGQRIRIEMSSDDFDTYLELFDENRVSLAEDDDGAARGTDSRLTFTLPRSGAYIVEARAFSASTGGYSLSISEIEPERPPEALAFGSTIQGEIGEGDSTDGEDRGFDAYAFRGLAGQRVQAIMRSGDFDTYLQVGRAGAEFEALASDDDGLGEGTDSRLNFSLPEDGDYVLRALPLGSSGKGLYSLELIDRGPQPRPGSLLVGATARGTLTETDATAEDNSYYDAYRLELKEDEKLLITMVSNEVDSFIVLGREQPDGGFEVLGSDDDSLSDTHAKLVWTAPADGTYEVRAGTFQQGQTGAYALTVEKQP